jgi:thiamine-phosphate pyrophosphorylase
VELLRALAPLCAGAGVSLFANDRPDLALLGGCAGVHVGQTDLSIRDVRRIAPTLRVGVSTHTLEELESALNERPDYVAFGPVFATTSKVNPDPVVGLDGLKAASALSRAHGVPLVAIGGIGPEHSSDLEPLVDAVAIISGLLPTRGADLSSVTERASAFSRAFSR